MSVKAILKSVGRTLLLAICAATCSGANLAAEPTARTSGDETLRIGVLAFRGSQNALAEWQGHADYLAKRLAPKRFVIVPLTLDEVGPAVAARKIDLVITNTGHYVELEAGGSISRIATMRIAGPK